MTDGPWRRRGVTATMERMWQQIVDRVVIESDLVAARRRARDLMPFSPAWDAAIALTEDLERAMWRLEPDGQVVMSPIHETCRGPIDGVTD